MIPEGQEQLYRYITGILKNKRCHVYQVNGVEDHLHIAMALHPSVSLAGLIKDIKLATSKYIREENLFPDFSGWQEGYGAFTYAVSAKENLINYIRNQKVHHKSKTSREEYISLLKEHGVEYDEKYIL